MQRSLAIITILASLAALSCSSAPPPPTKWTTGFWQWGNEYSVPETPDAPLDVLFVQAGSINRNDFVPRPGREAVSWYVVCWWPRKLAPAREYWLVFRYERQGVPDLSTAPTVASKFTKLHAEASHRNIKLAGIQLDIDSPTGKLSTYAEFVKKLRSELPPDTQISITALLDWFRTGTDIDDVIDAVDEFVPQFYDIGSSGDYRGETAIAASIDAAKWAPVFNRFKKRYRLGISTFGRARIVPASPRRRYSDDWLRIYNDLSLADIASHNGFLVAHSRNDANESVLSYRAAMNVTIAYRTLRPGDIVEFAVATPESIQSAVAAARKFGGYMAGVIFFRLPTQQETLTMQPAEVLAAAGAGPKPARKVVTVNGRCAAVECVDLYLEGLYNFSPGATRLRVQASAPLEYILPEPNLPARLAGPTVIDIAIPPYCARGRLYVGRVVSIKPAEFTIEASP